MRIFNKIIGVMLVLILSGACFAQDVVKEKQKPSVLVISERVEQANSKYLIYPEVSELIAAEVINKLNTDGVIKSPTLSSVREKLKSPELVYYANKLLTDYRYTYELNYDALKKIAQKFNTTNVLLVTGGLDTVSDFIKPTWWSFLNVPGENVVKTEYRLYTYLALVDLNSETIKWQNTYHRQITAPEFALASATYSPDYRQLNKLKKVSVAIAKDVAYRVEGVLTPWYTKNLPPPTVPELVKFKVDKKYKEYVQNINDFKAQVTAEKPEKTENKFGTWKRKFMPWKKETETLIPAVIIEKEPVVDVEVTSPTEAKSIDSVEIQLQKYEINEVKKDKNIQVSPLNIIIPKM